VLSGINTVCTGHNEFVKSTLDDYQQYPWRICSWHKNQRLMQVGEKQDEVGWDLYETCREGGAIIATAHSHEYARTHLMSNFQNQVIASTNNTLFLERGINGKSFVVVSGLGGESVREEDASVANNPWWGSKSTATQGGTYGCLFCIFNVDGDSTKTNCYFKNIRGEITDSFHVVAPSLTN